MKRNDHICSCLLVKGCKKTDTGIENSILNDKVQFSRLSEYDVIVVANVVDVPSDYAAMLHKGTPNQVPFCVGDD